MAETFSRNHLVVKKVVKILMDLQALLMVAI
jgi:hypothetical protein